MGEAAAEQTGRNPYLGSFLGKLQAAPSMDIPQQQEPEPGVATGRGFSAAALQIRTFLPLPADKGISLPEQLQGQGSFCSGEVSGKQFLPRTRSSFFFFFPASPSGKVLSAAVVLGKALPAPDINAEHPQG